ncbi:MAG: ABC transporter substrate-binding protein [Candidatus Aenigmarchaeota archaeon]|nr:ABC transporter substrate-binding protein [Candidatus Aenigmarchaeota archaeon]
MKRRTQWIVIVIVVLILAAYGTYLQMQQPKEETIKIGAILPLTGLYSENGQNSLRGYELAVGEINSKGGINGKKIELVIEDHKGDDNVGAVNAYHSIQAKGVKIILGPNHSPTGLAVAPIACQDKALLISPSIGTKKFSPTCNTIFDVWPVDYANSKKLGEIVVRKGYKKISILGSVQEWEKEQADAAKEGVLSENGNLANFIITDNSPAIVNADITKIISSGTDAVIFTNYGYMDIYARKLKEFGSDGDFFVVILDETRKDNAQGAFENAIVISSYSPTQEFIEKFSRKYNTKPDFPADTSYDAVMILANSIKETNSTDPPVLSEYMLKIKNYAGASGNFSFTSSGDVTKEPIFQTVQNNTIVMYEG